MKSRKAIVGNRVGTIFRKLFICVVAVFFWCTPDSGLAQATNSYSNSGDNSKGFALRYGSAKFTSNEAELVGASGGGWYALPVKVSGDFQISFDVYNNSNDGDSHLLLVNDSTNAGIDVRNSPQGTDTPSINIFSGTNLVDYQQFYFPRPDATLASAPTTDFPNATWTHVVITKRGNILTDSVGGQSIQADLSDVSPASIDRVGLGYYATSNLGGAGQLRYRNIVVMPAPPGNQSGLGYHAVLHDGEGGQQSYRSGVEPRPPHMPYIGCVALIVCAVSLIISIFSLVVCLVSLTFLFIIGFEIIRRKNRLG